MITVAAARNPCTAGNGLGQASRRVERSQLGLPEGLGNRRVLALQPGDIVAVVRGLRLRHQAGVTLQHFAQQA
ncbi:hypothetical protein D3C81_803060 [compost metagenome]